MCLFGTKTSHDFTSLDNMLQISPYHEKKNVFVSDWGKKQRRGYHRVVSGIKKGIYNGDRLRFLTLTNKTWNFRLNQDFQALKQRIRRAGYHFEYWKCRTSEGGGVLHIVYRGDYIPQNYISECWYQITGDSYVVDIREIDTSDYKCVARYVVSQHLTGGQGIDYVRSSWSWNWVCKGFVKVWKGILSLYVNTHGIKYCVGVWDRWLAGSLVPDSRHIVAAREKERKLLRAARKKVFDGRMMWLGQDSESIYKKKGESDT